jgi:hypothetical protein
MDAIAVVHARIGPERRTAKSATTCNHSYDPLENLHDANTQTQGTQEMSNKITIALSAALLFAAAASAASAAGPRAPATNDAIASVCNEQPSLLQAGGCGAGPHCQYFDIGDRSVGPTFPTACRQTT